MLQVQWKSKKFGVDFRHLGPRWAEHVTLGELMQQCSEETGVPVERLRLLHSGGKCPSPSWQSGWRGRRDTNAFRESNGQTDDSPSANATNPSSSGYLGWISDYFSGPSIPPSRQMGISNLLPLPPLP